eukprot:5720865-Amphidinium_carterae.1
MDLGHQHTAILLAGQVLAVPHWTMMNGAECSTALCKSIPSSMEACKRLSQRERERETYRAMYGE